VLPLELVQKTSKLFPLELVRNRASDETREPTRTDALANGLGELAGETNRELGSGLGHDGFLPW